MSTPQDPFGPPGEQPPAGGNTPWGAPSGPPPSGSPYDQPGTAPYDRPASPPYGQPDGAPYGQPAAAPYGQPYGQPPGQPAWGSAPGPAGARRNGLGVASLVLGLLGLLLFWTVVGGILLGLAAVVLGVLGRGRVRRGEADNGGTATAGIVLGVLAVLASALAIAAGLAFFTSDTGRSLVDCLEQAGSDQAAIEQCQSDVLEQQG